jgi:hypothetical protein
MPPTNPTVFVLLSSAASAPTRIGTFLFAELERHQVGRQRVAGVHGVVDARELLVRELHRQLADVVGEQEADAEHELGFAGGELAHRGLADRRPRRSPASEGDAERVARCSSPRSA